MGKEDNHDKKVEKEGENMSALLEKKRLDLQEKLNKISANSPILKTNNGKIELDPNNPQHREWFEDDNNRVNEYI